MKAITIRQPWAWAIIHAGKDIENRDWPSRYRGLLAIHAGKSRQPEPLPRGVTPPEILDYGAILGVVTLADVVERSRSRWFHGQYGFVLADPIPLSEPVPCGGQLGLWNVPEDVERLVKRRLPRSTRRPE